MEQSSYYVNCPYCGKITEAICPFIDRVPKKVQAFGKDTRVMYTNITDVGCTCGKQMKVSWNF